MIKESTGDVQTEWDTGAADQGRTVYKRECALEE